MSNHLKCVSMVVFFASIVCVASSDSTVLLQSKTSGVASGDQAWEQLRILGPFDAVSVGDVVRMVDKDAEALQIMKSAFEHFDLNDSGDLDAHELHRGLFASSSMSDDEFHLQVVGLEAAMDVRDVQQFVAGWDSDDSGTLDKIEFATSSGRLQRAYAEVVGASGRVGPDMCKCTGKGNQIQCSKSGTRYCGGSTECTHTILLKFGDWSMCTPKDANMCKCTGKGNQIQCSKSGNRYCGSSQNCRGPIPLKFGDWSMCTPKKWGDTCGCTGNGGEIKCSVSGTRYCGSGQHCTGTKALKFGNWGMCTTIPVLSCHSIAGALPWTMHLKEGQAHTGDPGTIGEHRDDRWTLSQCMEQCEKVKCHAIGYSGLHGHGGARQCVTYTVGRWYKAHPYGIYRGWKFYATDSRCLLKENPHKNKCQDVRVLQERVTALYHTTTERLVAQANLDRCETFQALPELVWYNRHTRGATCSKFSRHRLLHHQPTDQHCIDECEQWSPSACNAIIRVIGSNSCMIYEGCIPGADHCSHKGCYTTADPNGFWEKVTELKYTTPSLNLQGMYRADRGAVCNGGPAHVVKACREVGSRRCRDSTHIVNAQGEVSLKDTDQTLVENCTFFSNGKQDWEFACNNDGAWEAWQRRQTHSQVKIELASQVAEYPNLKNVSESDSVPSSAGGSGGFAPCFVDFADSALDCAGEMKFGEGCKGGSPLKCVADVASGAIKVVGCFRSMLVSIDVHACLGAMLASLLEVLADPLCKRCGEDSQGAMKQVLYFFSDVLAACVAKIMSDGSEGCINTVNEKLEPLGKLLGKVAMWCYDKFMESLPSKVKQVGAVVVAVLVILFNALLRILEAFRTGLTNMVSQFVEAVNSVPDMCSPTQNCGDDHKQCQGPGLSGYAPTDCNAFWNFAMIFKHAVCFQFDEIQSDWNKSTDGFKTCLVNTGVFNLPAPFFLYQKMKMCVPEPFHMFFKVLIGSIIFLVRVISAIMSGCTGDHAKNWLCTFIIELIDTGNSVKSQLSEVSSFIEGTAAGSAGQDTAGSSWSVGINFLLTYDLPDWMKACSLFVTLVSSILKQPLGQVEEIGLMFAFQMGTSAGLFYFKITLKVVGNSGLLQTGGTGEAAKKFPVGSIEWWKAKIFTGLRFSWASGDGLYPPVFNPAYGAGWGCDFELGLVCGITIYGFYATCTSLNVTFCFGLGTLKGDAPPSFFFKPGAYPMGPAVPPLWMCPTPFPVVWLCIDLTFKKTEITVGTQIYVQLVILCVGKLNGCNAWTGVGCDAPCVAITGKNCNNAPTPPHCTDVAGWTDRFGGPCSVYEAQGRCVAGALSAMQTRAEMSAWGSPAAYDACCACGGGVTSTSPPAPPPTPPHCTDVAGWTDKFGGPCSVYEAQGRCVAGALSNMQTRAEMADWGSPAAYDACCACGRGVAR